MRKCHDISSRICNFNKRVIIINKQMYKINGLMKRLKICKSFHMSTHSLQCNVELICDDINAQNHSNYNCHIFKRKIIFTDIHFPAILLLLHYIHCTYPCTHTQFCTLVVVRYTQNIM